MKTNLHFCLYLAQFFLKYEIFHTEVVEKNKTLIPYSGTFFQNRPFMVYEIIRTNIVGPGRKQMAT